MRRAIFLLAATALAGLPQARAATADQRIDSIQAQIQALSAELARMKRELAAKDAAVRTARQEAAQAHTAANQAQAAVASAPPPRPPPAAAPSTTPVVAETPASPSFFGAGPAHPDDPSPKTDFTSLNAIGGGAQSQAANGGAGRKGEFHIGGVTIQLGGFFEGSGLYRTRAETTDLASNFNTGIPLPQSEQYHEGEFRGSARQSRFAVLVHGDVDADQHVAGYAELDLQGAAGTANSNESDSYNPRVRQAYVSYDNDAGGWHVLAGQAWSLATLTKTGVAPRQEALPPTIDQQYVPGFTWARQPQLRVAKDFGGKYWLAASLESPQTTYSVGSNGTGVNFGTASYTNPGISTLTPGQNYSTDIAPDVIAKFAMDPGWGHYEAYGMARFFQDRVSVVGNGHSNTRLAGGVGAGAYLPLVPKALDLQFSGLAGYGIGRYGTSQLPDATISRSGAPSPLPQVQALVGLIGHPAPSVDLYTFVGTEQIGRKYFNANGKSYGYGNPLYSNAGCDIELSTATCTANTSGVTQGTVGAWWRFLQGDYGTVQAGVQYSYTRRNIYKGASAPGGSGNAATDDNMLFFTLRYLPFQ